MSDELTVETDVGFAGFGDNSVRGLSVGKDLMGGAGFWSAYSISIRGPRLDREQAHLIDELGVACIAGDPRNWPLKVAWLVASYGSAWAGVAACTASLPGAFVGPAPADAAALVCQELARASRDNGGVDGMLRWIDAQRRSGQRIAGFGVPGKSGGRDADERIPMMRTAVESSGLDGEHFRRIEELVAALDSSKLRANGALYLNAILLDLGFSPQQCPMIVIKLFDLMIWAHAHEASLLRPPPLQGLPLEKSMYVGPPRRTTPRSARSRG